MSHLQAQNVIFLTFFIDAKTYNLDVFQHLKHTNRYIFLVQKHKIFTYLLYH